MAEEKKIADEKKISDEKLDNEQLEQVAGGISPYLLCVPNNTPNTDTITCKEKIISFGK